MKFLKKLKSSNFWVSMISAVVLILQAVFNVDIKTEYLNQIILGILGVLVMTGIVTDSPSDEVTVKQNVDIDSINKNIQTILAESTVALQNTLKGVITQFEHYQQLDTTDNFNNDNILQTEKAEESIVDENINQQVKETKNIERNHIEEVKSIEQNQVVEQVKENENLNVL